jgi:hypothetical protein
MACKAACATDNDCKNGYGCSSGQCTPKTGAKCGPDGHSVIDPSGMTSDCSPFTCAGGQCNKMCASIGDCVAPNVCDPTGQCVAPAQGNGDTGSSGGCAVVAGDARDRSFGAWALVGVAAAIATVSRRRRARR